MRNLNNEISDTGQARPAVYIVISIIAIFFAGVSCVGFPLAGYNSVTPTIPESPIPLQKAIELTYAAAGTQTAVSYSPTPPPSPTHFPTLTLQSTMTPLSTIILQPAQTITEAVSTADSQTAGGCDPGDQAPYVYSPDRLIVVSDCIHVTGIIEEVRAEADGDLHILLKLDSQYTHLLRPANSKESSDLVIEPVCVHKSTHPAATKVCNTDPDPLTNLPKVGQYVWMEGRYVTDTFHGGWAEIHPLGRWGLAK
jgi:hypothetical protein